ncbi:MAG: trypsin-like peptidase domain-containing protein [Gemmatimonadetes bacterium]|nr:trypsin-like peptidase domain-containing protein [Gemmatimonadota bacterium]
MSARTRDWSKFVSLVGIAFILGLLFASALDLPKRSGAAEPLGLVQAATPAPRAQIPAAKPAADLGEAFAAVAAHVQPAVVFIRSEHRERASARRLPPGFEDFFPQLRQPQPQIERGTGSGFIVSENGYILTNNHVVSGAERVTVRLYDKREFPARVVGADPATDVAVIKIDATALPTVGFGNSDSTRIGEWVLAIGNPLGEAFTFTVTAGIISAKGRLLRGLEQVRNYSIQDFLQTDAAINPGNSGGPLVNVRGDVIGINAAIASETGFYAGYGFAIPINLARIVMDQLVRTGHVQRAVIGVSIRDAVAEDAEAVGLVEVRGVVVQDFIPDASASPAGRAGVQQGDVIVALDGQPVEYVAQLQQRVGFKKPGEAVRVTVLRPGGERREYTVRLAAVPTEEQIAANDDNSGADDGTAKHSPAPKEETLGIAVQPVAPEDATDRSLRAVRQAGGGLVVTGVSPDGPAYGKLAGPGPGGPDVILKVNGTPVRTRAEFRAALRGLKAGDIVSLLVFNVAAQGQGVVRIKLP